MILYFSQVACTRRDFLLYALSVGVPEDDLQWLYELGKLIKCLHTTAILTLL